MIKIDPYFKDEPKELWQEATRSRNQSKDNLDRKSKIDLALSQKSKHKFDRKVYGLTVVKNKLEIIFHHKCAFCESTMKGALPDVEHFRFKKHYYWLGYEWTNLLLSCQICNRYFKGTHFPLLIERNRVQSPNFNNGTGALDKAACHKTAFNSPSH
jgi:hypothetical protein